LLERRSMMRRWQRWRRLLRGPAGRSATSAARRNTGRRLPACWQGARHWLPGTGPTH